MDEILKDPNRCVSHTRGVGGILARLWRIILFETNVNVSNFENLCGNFVLRARRGLIDANVKNYFNKGNLRRELAKPSMTFKVFVKALKVLEVVSFTITIELQHRRGKITTHSTKVDTATFELMEHDEED